MSWSNSALVTLLLVVQGVVGIFGGYAGYEVEGVPQGGAVAESSPGILGVLEWVWDAITFMFNMVTFQVDDMPYFISLIFVIMGLLSIYLIVKLARGIS